MQTCRHYLLAASGVSTGATLRDWQSFATQAGLSTTGASGPVDTDLEGYIANLQSQSTLAMISEGLEQSKRDFDTFLENNVQMEWDAQRRRIYEHLGLARPAENLNASQGDTASPAARGAFGRSSRRGPMSGSTRGGMSFKGSTMPRSVIGTPGAKGFGRSTAAMESPEKSVLSPPPENRFTRDKQEKFAGKVRQLNLARLRDEVYPILKEFAEVEQSSGTDVSLIRTFALTPR
jgi:nuclear pore complex protein Nup93